MKRLFKPGPVLSLGVFLVLAVALAGSFPLGAIPRSVTAASRPQVLRVFAHLDLLKTISVGTPSDMRGTHLVFQDSVFDETDTHKIGSDNGTCMYTTNTMMACQIVFIFPQGDIAVQGPETLSGATTTVVITGGTGSYSGAQGQETVHLVKTSKGSEIAITFQFTK